MFNVDFVVAFDWDINGFLSVVPLMSYLSLNTRSFNCATFCCVEQSVVFFFCFRAEIDSSMLLSYVLSLQTPNLPQIDAFTDCQSHKRRVTSKYFYYYARPHPKALHLDADTFWPQAVTACMGIWMHNAENVIQIGPTKPKLK